MWTPPLVLWASSPTPTSNHRASFDTASGQESQRPYGVRCSQPSARCHSAICQGPPLPIDHDTTKLVSNVADAALAPKEAAKETLTIIREIIGKDVNGSRRYG